MLTGDSTFDNFLTIRLVDGMLAFSFQNLGPSLDDMTSALYNDGMIHTFQFTHFRRDINFVVDGREQIATTSVFSGENNNTLTLKLVKSN